MRSRRFSCSVVVACLAFTSLGGPASAGLRTSSSTLAALQQARSTARHTSPFVTVPGIGAVRRPRFGAYVRLNRALAQAQPLVAVSDYRDGIIFLYTQYTHALMGLLGAYVPMHLASDAAGNLYSVDGEKIYIYDATVAAVNTLDDTGHQPLDVAADSDGTVYVSDDRGVAVFPKGQTQPSRILTDGVDTLRGYSLSVAANHDLYAQMVAGTGIFHGGKPPFDNLHLAEANGFVQIQVANGYVAALTELFPSSIAVVKVFAPRHTRPSWFEQLPNVLAVAGFDYASDKKSYFVGDQTGEAYQFAYPSGANLGYVLCGENGFCGGVTAVPHPPG